MLGNGRELLQAGRAKLDGLEEAEEKVAVDDSQAAIHAVVESDAPAGSQTRFGLASLFHTWQARRLNPYREFLTLLVHPSALSPRFSFPLT